MPRQRQVDLTLVREWKDGTVRAVQDHLAGEEPLEIRLGRDPVSVVMRTPGHDQELAAGFLFTEGLVQSREQIRSIGYSAECKASERGNVLEVQLAQNAAPDGERLKRNFFTASGCGICGKATIEAIRAKIVRSPNPGFRISPEILCGLPAALLSRQEIFKRTGGLHAAGLFDADGKLMVHREDVGRHNAVDKVIGWALRTGQLPLQENVLLVSGRSGFEIVQKAAVAGVPVLASVSAPSSLAVQLARELRVTLVGFLRGRRFLVYAGGERIGMAAHPVRGGEKPENTA